MHEAPPTDAARPFFIRNFNLGRRSCIHIYCGTTPHLRWEQWNEELAYTRYISFPLSTRTSRELNYHCVSWCLEMCAWGMDTFGGSASICKYVWPCGRNLPPGHPTYNIYYMCLFWFSHCSNHVAYKEGSKSQQLHNNIQHVPCNERTSHTC